MVITHDPLEYIDSYNPFTFASLDPVNFWDPWGLSPGSLAGGSDIGMPGGTQPKAWTPFLNWEQPPLSNDPDEMLVYNGENPCAVIPDAIHCKSGPPPSSDELEDRRDPDAGDVAKGAAKAALGEALYAWCVSATVGTGAVPCAFVAGALQDHLAPIQNEDEALGAAIFFLSQIVAGLSKGLVKGAIDEFIDMLRAARGMKRQRALARLLTENPKRTFSSSAEEISARMRKNGYETTIEQSTKGSKRARVIRVKSGPDGAESITQVRVHPGGGRHVGPYVTMSTNSGQYKLIDKSYKVMPDEDTANYINVDTL